MCATPRRCEGESASAQSAATAGVSSPTSCRSRSMPWRSPVPRDRQPVGDARHLAAHRGEDLAQRVARLGRGRRPVADGDASRPSRRGQRQEGRGVGEVGLDDVVERRDRPGRDGPAVGVGVVDLDAVRAQHRDGHLDVGERGHRLAVVADVDAVLVAGAGQQQRRDELRGRRRVDHDRAAAHRAGAADGERQRAPAAVVDRRRPAPRSAVSTSPTGRLRMWGSPSKAMAPSRARPPAARSA